MTLSIVAGATVDADKWDAYVNGSPASSLYHLHSWGDVIRGTFGHEPIYLSAIDDDGAWAGVLPLVQLRSRIFGNMLVSVPYFNYAGICAEGDGVHDRLFEAAVDVARQRGSDFLEIRHEGTWRPDLPCKTTKVAMRRPLPGSPDELWKQLGSKLRNQVQRPRKEGMTAAVGRLDRLDDFYAVFSANMRDLGTPVYPKAFFRNILQTFPEQTWTVVVYSGTQPVAAGFLAGFRDRVEIPWASSLRAFNKFSPNMLLYWTCLEFACGRGYRVFDFGRSTRGESTYRFKEQWGATASQLYWYYWLRNGGDIPQVNPDNPKYRAAIAAWKRLPLGVTRWLGPRIVKYIP